jgi:3-hydroxyisobutyrate dehydrogenase
MERFSIIGFVGLGTMGLPMASNFLKAGLEVHGFDLDKDAEAALRERGGASGFSTVAEACRGVDAVFTSLPNTQHVQAALVGADGVLSALEPGSYVVDVSTISPTATKELAEQAQQHGVLFADAPVSGSSIGAETATLTMMVGASDSVFSELRPLLQVLGSNIFHVGGVGAGESIKLINNLLVAINAAAVAEAYAIASKTGIEPQVMYDVVSKSTGDSWVWRNRIPVTGIVPGSPVEDDFSPGFAASLMRKDLDLAREFASELGTPILLGSMVRELFSSVMAQGWGAKDYSILAKFYDMVGKHEASSATAMQ